MMHLGREHREREASRAEALAKETPEEKAAREAKRKMAEEKFWAAVRKSKYGEPPAKKENDLS